MNNKKDAMPQNGGSRVKGATVWLRIIILLLSLIILTKIVSFNLAFQHVRDIPLLVLGILVTLAILQTWLLGIRWQLVNPDVSGQLTGGQYFRLLMMTKPFNLVMPGALGGDFVKTFLTLKAVNDNRVTNVIAIVVDHFIGLASITVMGSIAFFFMSDIQEKEPFYVVFGLLGVGFSTILVVAGNQWVLRLLESFCSRLGTPGKHVIHFLETWKNVLSFFRFNYHRLLLALLLCLPIHGLSFLTTYLLALNLGIMLSFFDICLILAIVWVITSIPITISGVGVRELSLIYFLSLYGVKAEPATALSISLYIVSIALGFIGLLFFLNFRRHHIL